MRSSSKEKGSGEQIDASAFVYACSELVLWQENDDETELAAQLHLDVNEIPLVLCLP
jgi:hypothetical protein